MRHTLGFHIVLSGFGLWLPGDDRGHWSDAWHDQLGYHEPHHLHPGDPVRQRMAAERMEHPPVRLTSNIQAAVADTLGRCAEESDWSVAAASVESTHTHLLLTYSPRDIDNTVKWLKDQTTKSVHRTTPHARPVWCKGRWLSYVFDPHVWQNTQRYIERHNVRRGVGSRPYPWIT